jgi:Cysteine-rich secretory protein family
MYRATLNLTPYTLDSQLSAFALAGSQELSMDHLPHQHFMNAGNGLWTMGFTSNAGENQGDPNGWRVLSASCALSNEEQQIAQIMQAMFNEGPAGDAGDHGHYLNMMSTTFKRVGVGLVEVSGKLYLTNDFSN